MVRGAGGTMDEFVVWHENIQQKILPVLECARDQHLGLTSQKTLTGNTGKWDLWQGKQTPLKCSSPNPALHIWMCPHPACPPGWGTSICTHMCRVTPIMPLMWEVGIVPMAHALSILSRLQEQSSRNNNQPQLVPRCLNLHHHWVVSILFSPLAQLVRTSLDTLQ